MSSRAKENKLKIIVFSLLILITAAFLIARFAWLGLVIILIFSAGIYLFNLILKNPLIGLILTVFTLPFERIPTFDIGFITLKADQFFAGMTLVALILKILLEKKKIAHYPIIIPVLFYLIVSIISTFYAQDFSRSLSMMIFVIFMILVSIVTVNIINNKEQLIKIIKILFISSLAVGIFGLYQFFGDVIGLPITLTGLKDIYTKAVLGFPRIQAFSMEPLYLANFLFIPLGLASGLYFFQDKRIISRNKLLLLILLILMIIILGISRGAYLALIVMILFFAIFLLREVITIKNVIITLISIIIIGGASYGFLKISRPDALDQFISHAKVEDFSTGESVQKRLQDFSKAIEFWQTSPWTGIGPGNYGPAYKDYPSHDQVTGWEIVNNQYIESLTETGILGLGSLLLVFLIIIWRSITAYFYSKDPFLKAVIFGLLAAFIAILVQYNFFSTLYIMHIWVLIGLLIAVQNLCFKSEKIKNNNKNIKPNQ